MFVTFVGPRNHVLERGRSSKEKFLGLSGPLKSIMNHCCGVCSTNINGISAAAAADCIAPGGPVSN